MRGLSIAGLALGLALAACSAAPDLKGADQAVAVFHQRLDHADYQDIYRQATPQFQHSGTVAGLSAFLSAIHTKLGAVRSTQRQGYFVGVSTDGSYANVTYQTLFERGAGRETFSYRFIDSRAVMNGYHFDPAPPVVRIRS